MNGHREYFFHTYSDYLEKAIPRSLAQAQRTAKLKALDKTIRHYLQYLPLTIVLTTYGARKAPLLSAVRVVMYQLTDGLYYKKEGRSGHFYFLIPFDRKNLKGMKKRLGFDKCPFVQPYTPSGRWNFVELLERIGERILHSSKSRVILPSGYFIAHYGRAYLPLRGATLDSALVAFRKEFSFEEIDMSSKKKARRVLTIYDHTGIKNEIRARCMTTCKHIGVDHNHRLADKRLVLAPEKLSL